MEVKSLKIKQLIIIVKKMKLKKLILLQVVLKSMEKPKE